MNNIFDALEICLNELENGADMETVLARFPDLAVELRPILAASVQARNMAAPEPSQDAIRRGRARVMQRAAEMRESRIAPRKRVIPALQRLVLSFSLAAMLLLSSTGLLNASASALPGESLYPVKRTWEGLRLLLIFNKEAREHLADQFENERLHEVNELLVEGRDEVIQFAGVFMQVNGKNYVSGIPVILPADTPLPANGMAVVITGQTNSQGSVELLSFEQLPDGSVVPTGEPIEIELEDESDSESGSGSDNEAVDPRYSMEGTLQAVSATSLVLNGLTVYLDNAEIDGELCLGVQVEVEGYTAADGRFIVTKVKTKGSCSADNNNAVNENSNTNDDSDSNDNSDDSNDNGDDDSNDNGDDDSNNNDGGGGGGGDDNGGGDSGDDSSGGDDD